MVVEHLATSKMTATKNSLDDISALRRVGVSFFSVVRRPINHRNGQWSTHNGSLIQDDSIQKSWCQYVPMNHPNFQRYSAVVDIHENPPSVYRYGNTGNSSLFHIYSSIIKIVKTIRITNIRLDPHTKVISHWNYQTIPNPKDESPVNSSTSHSYVTYIQRWGPSNKSCSYKPQWLLCCIPRKPESTKQVLSSTSALNSTKSSSFVGENHMFPSFSIIFPWFSLVPSPSLSLHHPRRFRHHLQRPAPWPTGRLGRLGDGRDPRTDGVAGGSSEGQGCLGGGWTMDIHGSWRDNQFLWDSKWGYKKNIKINLMRIFHGMETW